MFLPVKLEILLCEHVLDLFPKISGITHTHTQVQEEITLTGSVNVTSKSVVHVNRIANRKQHMSKIDEKKNPQPF